MGKNFNGSYKIINDENKIILENNFLQSNELLLQSNPNELAKKLACKYIDAYKRELVCFVSVLFEGIKADIEKNNLIQQ